MKRPSHGTVVAYAALFIALSGSAYAAISLPANSVGTKQLRAGAVTLTKIASSAQTALHGQAGAAGPAGPAGPTGPQGPAGKDGTTGGSTSSTADLQQKMGIGNGNLGQPMTIGSLVLTPVCSLNNLRLAFGTTASTSTIVFTIAVNTNSSGETEFHNTYFAHAGAALSSQAAYSLSDNGSATSTGVMSFFVRDAGGKIVAGMISLEVDATGCNTGGYASTLN
jgi:hypothetical protein